jgi:hypothetical protein
MFDHCARTWGRFSLILAAACAGVLAGLLLVVWVASAAPQAPGVAVGPDHTGQADAGHTIAYNHILTNTGTTTDSILVETRSTQGWSVSLSNGEGPANTLLLQVAAQMTVPFRVSVTVPPDVVGVTEVTIITATSQLDSTKKDTALDTTRVPVRIYMPLALQHWPPIPLAPTLKSIDNVDGNGLYTVAWAEAQSADSFSLEEDVSADFANPTVAYSGSGLSWSIPAPGKSAGTYYYRVRGHNAWGYGDYSNVQAVAVRQFRADHVELPAGQCTTLRWEFDSINSLHISFGRGYDKEGVPGHGSRIVCPSANTIYEALAVKKDGSKETHKVTIDVTGSGCGDPVIWAFYANTYNVHPGEQFGIAWDVECAKTVHLIIGSGSEEPVTGKGQKDVRIYATTLFTLKVQKSDGNFVYRTFTVDVSS